VTSGPGAADGAPPGDGDLVISIRDVRARPSETPGVVDLRIETTRGPVEAHMHPAEGRVGCAVFVGGAIGGVEGPADGLYPRLAQALVSRGVTSLRVQYRRPGELSECVLDTLAGCSLLKGLGGEAVVIVGHSFGGAVAIMAGELSPLPGAVVALSAQRFGTQNVDRLAKPLLLIHGADDDVLLPAASEDIYARAQEPKHIVLLPGTGHALREAADEVFSILERFIAGSVGDPLMP
jgi:alpha/beta superfamily hydrolase